LKIEPVPHRKHRVCITKSLSCLGRLSKLFFGSDENHAEYRASNVTSGGTNINHCVLKQCFSTAVRKLFLRALYMIEFYVVKIKFFFTLDLS